MFTLGKAPAALILCAALAVSTSACTTFRGAPAPLIEPKQLESKPEFQVDTLIKTLVESGASQSTRDASIIKLLAVCDIRYADFRNELVSNRRHTQAAAGTLSLLTNVAASLTDSAGVKDNYIALSTLIQGGQTIYDRDYLLDRTLDALVAQMDANRKSQLVAIREGMRLDPQRYPAQVALADIINYYHAGTLNGALIGIQKSASEQQVRDTETLLAITDKTPAQIREYQDQTDWENAFVDKLSESQLSALHGYIASEARDKLDALPDSLAQRRVHIKQELGDLRDLKYQNAPLSLRTELIRIFGVAP